jgi:hypothetical protein
VSEFTTKTDLLRSYPVVVEWLASTPYLYYSYMTALGWYLAFRNREGEHITPDDLVTEIKKEVQREQTQLTWRSRLREFESWLRNVDAVEYLSKEQPKGRLAFNAPILKPETAEEYVSMVGNFHRYWEKKLKAEARNRK